METVNENLCKDSTSAFWTKEGQFKGQYIFIDVKVNDFFIPQWLRLNLESARKRRCAQKTGANEGDNRSGDGVKSGVGHGEEAMGDEGAGNGGNPESLEGAADGDARQEATAGVFGQAKTTIIGIK